MVRKDAVIGGDAMRDDRPGRLDHMDSPSEHGSRRRCEASPDTLLDCEAIVADQPERTLHPLDREAQLVGHFAMLAKMLDAAGLGPADYLYRPLKWRLQHQDVNQISLNASIL